MSLARQFFREFRPLFRMLEEPLGRSPAYLNSSHRPFIEDAFFRDPFQSGLRPAVDVTEEGNNYVVEAELPGVQKENVQVRIGDGGRSVTIQGKVVDRRGPTANPTQPEASSSGAQEAPAAAEGSQAVTTTGNGESTQLSAERSFVGTSSFTRTVWLPRRVDSGNVSAQLKDGILTLTIPKAEDPGSVEIPVQ
ncbi:HSP20-like chaperone [Irpex lacteus]|nr:HSP20-like chaperone [Irpex lacteus]